MPTVSTKGATIAYADSGPRDAPAVAFLHALGAHSGMWSAQVEAALAAGLRVLAPDLRGHGQSRLDPAEGEAAPEYTMDVLAGDVLAVLDHAGVARAAWVGLSIGGMAALRGASRHGARVSALVASNSSPGPAPREMWQQRRDLALAKGMAPLVEPTLERWFTPAFHASHPQVVERVRAMFAQADARAYAGCCAAIRDQDQRATLPGIACPTLVVAGSEDAATPPALSQVIHAAVPGSRLEVLPAAHLSNVECEAPFTALLVSFLRQHAAT